ncbi:myb/SANT-like DNA-binding domain-containing protein 3 [Prorops nasuta]|uniref:myb/SANT-like DNA-binding domain-containing protein 3 n=2 Tax=Prorops nasuta TaxID=863751 RepID=UPI0034CD20FE
MDISQKNRNENYSFEEKLALVDIIQQYSKIIENKQTDAVGLYEKNRTWNIICVKFNKEMQKDASEGSLKTLWSNIKKCTRKYFAKLKEETYKTGGGSNNVTSNILYNKAYEIIKTSVDGLENVNDSDGKFAAKETINVIEEIIAYEEENEDPNTDEVFKYLTGKGEINRWEKWNSKQLSKSLSKPLHNVIKGPSISTSSISRSSNDTKYMQENLLQSKIELSNLMKKDLNEKSNLEIQVLGEQLKKERLKVKLLEYKLQKECENNNNVIQVINSSDSSD